MIKVKLTEEEIEYLLTCLDMWNDVYSGKDDDGDTEDFVGEFIMKLKELRQNGDSQ